MRVVLLTDIHANVGALEAVYNEVIALNGESAPEAIWCLGDIVGYGPDPVPCMIWLEKVVNADPKSSWVLGNHDAMLADLLPDVVLEDVDQDPLEAIALNRKELDENDQATIFWTKAFTRERAKPQHHVTDGIRFTLVHGSQVNGHFLYRYVRPWDHGRFLPQELELLEQERKKTKLPQIQLFGHTHIPTLVLGNSDGEHIHFEVTPVEPDRTYALDSELILINPGSVGQPRDLDRRAAYAVLDTARREVVFRRTVYDWRKTAQTLNYKGYSQKLIYRLRTAAAHEDAPEKWIRHFETVRKDSS